MTDQWLLIIALAVSTFAIRLTGYLLGAKLPATGAWAQAFKALPGCLIASLLAVIIAQGDTVLWIAASIALLVAILTRSLVFTMTLGILATWALRLYT